MTLPIPDGAARKRNGRACFACRAAKSKCDGRPERPPARAGDSGEEAKMCSRCVSSATQCTWPPSRRFGRRDRRNQSAGGLPDSNLLQGLPSPDSYTGTDPYPVRSSAGPNLGHTVDGHVSNFDHLMGSLLSNSLSHLSPNTDVYSAHSHIQPGVQSYIDPAPQFVPPDNTADFNFYPSPDLSTSSSDWSMLGHQASPPPVMSASPTSSSYGHIAEVTPETPWGACPIPWQEVQQLICAFYDHFHPSVPILPSKSEYFSHHLGHSSSGLLYVICAIGARIVGTTRTDALLLPSHSQEQPAEETEWQRAWRLRAAMSLDEDDAFNGGPQPFPHAAHRKQLENIQALLLHVCFAHGLELHAQARASLRLAAQRALELRLYAVDDKNTMYVGVMEGAEEGLPYSVPHEAREAARRIWYELYTIDGMHTITSGKPSVFMEVARDFPGAMNPKVEMPGMRDAIGASEVSDTYKPQGLHLRYKVLNVISQCSSPPPRSAVRQERFTTLKKSIDNLLLTTRARWEESLIMEKGFLRLVLRQVPSTPTIGGEATLDFWRAEREAAFMALMMLYSASIFLHYLHAAAPPRQLTMNACSIDTNAAHIEQIAQISADPAWSQGSAKPSHESTMTTRAAIADDPQQQVGWQTQLPRASYLDKIITSSQLIFATVRVAHDHAYELHSLVRGASRDKFPMFNALGYGPVNHGSSVDNEVSLMTDLHSPFFGCSQIIGSFGLMLGLSANGCLDGGSAPDFFPFSNPDTTLWFEEDEVRQTVHWRQEGMRSDIDLARDVLTGQTKVWPVSRSLCGEISRVLTANF